MRIARQSSRSTCRRCGTSACYARLLPRKNASAAPISRWVSNLARRQTWSLEVCHCASSNVVSANRRPNALRVSAHALSARRLRKRVDATASASKAGSGRRPHKMQHAFQSSRSKMITICCLWLLSRLLRQVTMLVRQATMLTRMSDQMAAIISWLMMTITMAALLTTTTTMTTMTTTTQ